MPALDSPEALTAALARIGCVSAADEAAALLAHTSDPAALATLVGRRAQGEPLEVLLGHAELAGVRVRVDPGVFLPRQRSELLAAAAVDEARLRDRPVCVDVCCGTGVLAAVLAARVPGARVVATDVEPAAVACATANGAAYGFEVVAGDLCARLPEALRGRVDVLVANVPHVPTGELGLLPRDTRAHEPAIAHDGGTDGLAVLTRLAAEAGAWLAPDGVLLIELAEHQARPARDRLAATGYRTDVVADPELRTVVLSARLG